MKIFKDDKHRKKIIDRIQKILALGNSTSFEEDAQTAFKIAKGLMTSYGLDMSEVDIKEEIENNIIEEQTEGKGKLFNWQKITASAIGNLCDTTLLIIRKNKKTGFKFIGFKQDVKLAINLYNLLIVTMKNSANKNYSSKTDRNSYLLGMADILCDRAVIENLLAKEVKQNYGALIIVKEKEINKFLQENYGNLKTAKLKTKINQEAYNKGKEDGRNIDLGKRKKID